MAVVPALDLYCYILQIVGSLEAEDDTSWHQATRVTYKGNEHFAL